MTQYLDDSGLSYLWGKIKTAISSEVEDSSETIRTATLPANVYAGTNVVILGDSYTQPSIANSEDEYWPKLFDSIMGTTRHNFAIAGAGWARSGNILTTQAETAASSMSASEKASTSLVIAMAGVNDLLNSVASGDVISGFKDCVGVLAQNFPNAKIVAVPFAYGCSGIDYYISNYISNFVNSAKVSTDSARVQFVENAQWWNYGLPSRYRNDVHPNVDGYRVIARSIVSAILGGGSPSGTVGSLISSFDNGTGTLYWNFHNGRTRFQLGWTADADILSPTNKFLVSTTHGMHRLMTPCSETHFTLYEAHTQTPAGILRILSDGRMTVNLTRATTGQLYEASGDFLPGGYAWS